MVRPIASSVGVSFRYGVKYKNGIIHKGRDYSDGVEGHDVLSCLAGEVSHAGYGGWGPAYGQHVIIKSDLEGKTRWMLYGHLKTENVKVGQTIMAGQKIGTSGGRSGAKYSGNSTGPHVHVQLGYENRYDRFLDPEPAIAAKADKEPGPPVGGTWFGAVAGNFACSDPVHGADSWDDRLPGLLKALTHYDRDVVMLVEASRKDNLPKLESALDTIGYKVAVYDAGRCIIVRKSIRVGRTKGLTLDERGPDNNDKQIVLAEIFPDGTASLVEVGHFEHHDGPQYDRTRLAQAKQTRAVVEAACREWGIPVARVVIYNDENARIGVNAAFGTTWPDIATHAPFYGNPKYSTLVTWQGLTVKNGYRPDKIRTHRSRTLIGGSTSLTFADEALADHLFVVATLARSIKQARKTVPTP